MKKSPLLMSTMAIEDIEQIWTYWMQKSSLEQADQYYKDIIHTLKKVQIDFSIGMSIESIREEYRMISLHEYAIYYLVNQNNTIEVIRVLPQKSNPNFRNQKSQ